MFCYPDDTLSNNTLSTGISVLTNSIALHLDIVHRHTPRNPRTYIVKSVQLTQQTPEKPIKGESVLLSACFPTHALLDTNSKYLRRVVSWFDDTSGNVFLRVTPIGTRPEYGKRGLEQDSLGSSVLWSDVDCYGHVDATIQALLSMAIPPNYIVRSGGGLQAYWSLNRFCDDWRLIKACNMALMQDINNHLGSDNEYADATFDASRVLRVPGTINYKRDVPVIATIAHYNSKAEYDISSFRQASIDKLTTINYPESEPLPDNFAAMMQRENPKLWQAISQGVCFKQDGSLDRSDNDWHIALAMLERGFTPGQCITVLISDDCVSKTSEKGIDYAITTVNKAVAKRIKEGMSIATTVKGVPLSDDYANIEVPTRKWLYPSEFSSMPKPKWFIKNYIPKRELILLYGPKGSFKTFVSLDIALTLARMGVRVLYVAAEDVTGVIIRARAWFTYHKADTDNFCVWPEPINLFREGIHELIPVVLKEKV